MKTLPELIRAAFAGRRQAIDQHILSGGCADYGAYLAMVAERHALIEGENLAIQAIQEKEEDDDYE